jgi:hypothetical protein
VPKAFEGGSETFFSLIYTSLVSSYDSLEPFLHIFPAPATLLTGLVDGAGHTLDLPAIIVGFLKGSGIPCPHLFDEVQKHFFSAVDLASINSPAFRSRIFCWAASGSPSIQVEGSQIEVKCCCDHLFQCSDYLYLVGLLCG